VTGPQAERELVIFELFVQAGLAVRDVEKRPPPEPDILCEVAGQGTLAFEVGEVVGQEFAQATYERPRLRQHFREVYGQLPADVRARIEGHLGGPPILRAEYGKGVSPGRWATAISPILEAISARAERLGPGAIDIWHIPGLPDLLRHLELLPSDGGAAELHASVATLWLDPTRELLGRKLGKHYKIASGRTSRVFHQRATRRAAEWLADVQRSSHLALPGLVSPRLDLRSVVQVHPACRAAAVRPTVTLLDLPGLTDPTT
jgi:hypothetical protein